jgi:hypothetical protein
MATVEEARRSNQGPFRAIAPLFRIALEAQRGEVLNVAKATAVLGPILGPNFTHHAAEAFLPQLVHLGWLVEEKANPREAAYRVPHDLPALEEAEAVEESSAKLERLFAAFQEFLERTAPLFALTLNQHEFQWHLFRWATSLDGSDKAAVRAQAEKIAGGERPSIKNAFLDETHRFSKIEKTLSVEFAGFVKWLVANERPEVADVAALTELGLAIEFLDELRNPSARADENIDTVFVLDAPVMLDLLGLSGPSRRDSIQRCVEVLRHHGGRIATLTHCLAELSDVIHAVLARPEHLRFGLTGDALRGRPDLVQAAREVASQPDRAARLFQVETLAFDPKSTLNASTFPDAMIDQFRNRAKWHDLDKSEQRERDAHSIAFVMRRRNGHINSDALDSRFILITRNSTFTAFSSSFVRSSLDIPNYAAGPAIETKTLAAFVWMRFGSAASPDLPQVQLISACDRILATNGELLRKAERRLRELSGDAAATALLSSQQAVLDLVVAAGGAVDVLDAAEGEAMLRAFTASAEERGKHEERRRSGEVEAALAERIEQEQQATEDERQHRLMLATEGLNKDAQLSERDDELRKRDQADLARAASTAARIVERSNSFAWRVVQAIWIPCTVIGLGGQLFIWRGADWWLKGPANFLAGALVLLCSAVALVFSLRALKKPWLVDLAGALQTQVQRSRMLSMLRDIAPNDEHDRVREALRESGHLG